MNAAQLMDGEAHEIAERYTTYYTVNGVKHRDVNTPALCKAIAARCGDEQERERKNMCADLQNLKSRLLAPVEIKYIEDGCFYHPELPSLDEDINLSDFFSVFGLEIALVRMESDAPQEFIDKYDSSEWLSSIQLWNPTQPDGLGWNLIAKYDTEDLPYAMFVRDAAMQKEKR